MAPLMAAPWPQLPGRVQISRQKGTTPSQQQRPPTGEKVSAGNKAEDVASEDTLGPRASEQRSLAEVLTEFRRPSATLPALAGRGPSEESPSAPTTPSKPRNGASKSGSPRKRMGGARPRPASGSPQRSGGGSRPSSAVKRGGSRPSSAVRPGSGRPMSGRTKRAPIVRHGDFHMSDQEVKVRAMLLQSFGFCDDDADAVQKGENQNRPSTAPISDSPHSISRLLAEQLRAAKPSNMRRPHTAGACRSAAAPPKRSARGEAPREPSSSSGPVTLRDAHAAVPDFPLPVTNTRQRQPLFEEIPAPPVRATTPTYMQPSQESSPQHHEERPRRPRPRAQTATPTITECNMPPLAAEEVSSPASVEDSPGPRRKQSRRSDRNYTTPPSSPPVSSRQVSSKSQPVGSMSRVASISMGPQPSNRSRGSHAKARGVPPTSRVESGEHAGRSVSADGSVSMGFGDFELPTSHFAAESQQSAFQQTAELTNRTEQRRMTPESRAEWIALFQRLANDGEVHRDILGRALELGGLPCPVEEWINGVFDGMSRFTTLNLEEFMIFVECYLDKQHEEYTAAFQRFDDDGSGTIDQPELTHLLASLDIVPMKWVVEEILEEVAEESLGTLNLAEFEETLKVLKQREGFSKFEYERIMAAFRLYDHDDSGNLDTRECIGLFGYLYYSLSPDAVRELVHDVDFDGSGQLNEREFLMCMRKAREYEVDRIQSALNFLLGQRRQAKSWEVGRVKGAHDEEEEAHPEICRTETWARLRLENFTASDLSDFLRYFGIVAERDAVLEAIRDAGLELPMKDFGLDEAWRFLEVFRSREGFTRAEAADIEDAFRQHVPKQMQDRGHIAELDRLSVGKALKWLGHEASFELQQLLIAEVDIDSKGFLGLPEFKKLIRKYRERELDEIKRALFSIGLYETHPDSDDSKMLVTSEDYLAAMFWLGRRPSVVDTSTPKKMDVEELEGGIMKQNGSLHQALEERRRVRTSYRHYAGFSPQQVTDLKAKFDEFDTGKTGEVSKQQLRNLFEDLFPEDEMHSRQTRSAIVMLLREVDDNGDGALDFGEFLHLMAQAGDRQVKQKLTREQIVVEQSGFTPMEVKEFREIFLMFDTRGTDRILFRDIKAIMSRVVPMGDKFKAQLKDLCLEVLEGRAEHMDFDFPSFLRLMRRVLDTDFGDMRAKTEVIKNLSAVPHTARRLSGLSSNVTGKRIGMEDSGPQSVGCMTSSESRHDGGVSGEEVLEETMGSVQSHQVLHAHAQ